MNERIRELVKQAGGRFSTHTLTSYPAQHRESIELWDQNIEKFAELIVKECAEKFTKIWYEQGLDIRGAELGKFMKRFQEDIGVEE